MTTEIVSAHAVTPDALPLNKLTLIGVFHAPDAPSALIRTARGEITKVAPGDTLGNQTVTAISDDRLILAAPGGTQTVLQMPS